MHPASTTLIDKYLVRFIVFIKVSRFYKLWKSRCLSHTHLE